MVADNDVAQLVELKKAKLERMQYDLWRGNPSQFIRDCVITRDEARQGQEAPFPELEYLNRVDELFYQEPVLCISKSRRMMMTWRILALLLHEQLFYPNLNVFVQSKKSSDSAYLLGDERLMFMYSRLPENRYLPTVTKKKRDISGKGYDLIQYSNGTSVTAVPEGPDQLRQYTASRVYCTEMAFWQSAEDTWMALKPTISGGGKIIIDSSANPGFFKKLVHGELKD